MSTFGSALRLARAVLPSGKKKMARRLAAKVAGPKRRARYGSKGIVTKKFTVIDERIVCASDAYVSGVDTFELADMPQFSNYIALYEQFRILKVNYHFRSLNPVNTGSATAVGAAQSQSLGYLHTVVDHNDATPFGPNTPGIQAMMNDNAYKGVKSSRDLTRTIRPMWLTEAGTQTAKSTRGWLNCRDVLGNINAVSHYGIKWVIQGGTATGYVTPRSVVYEPLVTYYIQFKNPQ